MSFKEASKKNRKECPGTSMGIHGHQSSHQFINYFPKPSPKYKDDDITDSKLKMLEPYNPEFAQLLNNPTGLSVRPSQYSGTVMNSAKQSVVENSTISGSMKPKFDLSKQINEINQKKYAKDKMKLNQAKEHNPQGERPNSSSTQKPIKKPQLNIEIEDDFGKEEEESLNKPLQVEGLGWNDAQIQQNVMESFRNYLHNIIQNPSGAVPHQAIDINQQFQSVSSKNGTQNFDFGAVTDGRSAKAKQVTSNGNAQQSSSRRHAHGTNRYNKNGFMMVTSSSMDSNSLDHEYNLPL